MYSNYRNAHQRSVRTCNFVVFWLNFITFSFNVISLSLGHYHLYGPGREDVSGLIV